MKKMEGHAKITYLKQLAKLKIQVTRCNWKQKEKTKVIES